MGDTNAAVSISDNPRPELPTYSRMSPPVPPRAFSPESDVTRRPESWFSAKIQCARYPQSFKPAGGTAATGNWRSAPRRPAGRTSAPTNAVIFRLRDADDPGETSTGPGAARKTGMTILGEVEQLCPGAMAACMHRSDQSDRTVGSVSVCILANRLSRPLPASYMLNAKHGGRRCR